MIKTQAFHYSKISMELIEDLTKFKLKSKPRDQADEDKKSVQTINTFQCTLVCIFGF